MKTFLILGLWLPLTAIAGQIERQKAWVIHNRVAGAPPTPAVLNMMEQDLIAGNTEMAVSRAFNHPNFLAVVMKNWFKPWANVEQSTEVQLNDFVALAVGMVRDNRPFRDILSADMLYTGNKTVMTTIADYANNNNDHFRDIENNFSTTWPTNLMPVVQSTTSGTAAAGVAGAISTRAFGEAYFSAGTNRRMTRYLFKNFLCKDFEQVHDVTIPDYRVRRDVERNPGNDSRTYKNKCVGCHAGQDALGGAWAFYNFTGGRNNYTAGQVQGKMNQNGNFYPDGYVTTNDSWINLWASGQNASLGWDPGTPTRGNGAAALGRMLANSRAFGECMASRAFELFCMHKPKAEDHDTIQELATEFMGTHNYDMKKLFTSTLTKCVVEEN